MMRKGVTGKILTFVISLIIGIMALALLWFFLSQGTDIVSEFAQKAIKGIKCNLFCKDILGFKMGMCDDC